MKIAFVVGEPSGDRIGADLVRGLRARSEGQLECIGLGGDEMAAEGVESLFDIEELSIIGIGGIVARLPQLLLRLKQTTDALVAARPDCVVLIDSPTFSHRVAKRLRSRLPRTPIVNYVPPTVWAWREERAGAMRAYIDRVICTFPFEPAFYEGLQGPPATYVGHPLLKVPGLLDVMARSSPKDARPDDPPTLLLLPGSRRGEIDRLLGDFGKTYGLLVDRMPGLRAVIPTLARHRARIEAETAQWPVPVEVVTGEEAKWLAFGQADAALAASGTVSLELALAAVPMAVAYKLDPIAYRFRGLVTAWTAALPNFVVDHPLVPEHFDEFVRPEHLARRLERLLTDTLERRAQMDGFATIRDRMAIDRDPGEAAAEIVIDLVRRGRS